MRKHHALLPAFLFCLWAAIPAIVQADYDAQSDYYSEPGINKNRDYVAGALEENIDPFTGALNLSYTDIFIPGPGGMDLRLVRSYSSANIRFDGPSSIVGFGWNMHFGRVLISGPGTVTPCSNNQVSVRSNPVLELPDGSRQLLYYTRSTPLILTADRWKGECASGLFIMYSPDGIRYEFGKQVSLTAGPYPTNAYYVTRMEDRNGNWIAMQYPSAGVEEISSVTTSDGRSLSFTYADAGWSSHRVTSVRTGDGRTWQYRYEPVPNIMGRQRLIQVIPPAGEEWTYTYYNDMSGAYGDYHLATVTNPWSGKTTYAYAAVDFDPATGAIAPSEVVSRKTTSDGGDWSFSYTAGGAGTNNKTIVTGPEGTVTYEHVGPMTVNSGSMWSVGLLAKKTYGSTRTETYTWAKQQISPQNYSRPGYFSSRVDTGSNAPVLSKRVISLDGQSYSTTYSNFDTYGNPKTIVEAGPNGGNRTSTLIFLNNTAKWIVKQVDDVTITGGRATVRTWDMAGNLLTEAIDGVTTSHVYDLEGNISRTTRPGGRVYQYSGYNRGIPEREIWPEGITITRQVSSAGNVISEANGEGWTTDYQYDDINRIIRVTPPRGNLITINYGGTSRTVKRGLLSEVTQYDDYGRPISISAGGVARAIRYDDAGRKTFESNPGSTTVGRTYTLDILGRVTQIKNPDNSLVKIAHGAAKVTTTDERGKVTVETFRAYGDPDVRYPMSITAPIPASSVSVARDSRDRVTSLTQNSVSRTYAYNSNGYLTSVTYPETGTTTYGRDIAGNMISRKVATSATTTYQYDGLNRLTAIGYPSSAPSVTKTYTRTGKLKAVSSTSGVRTFSYDESDNLTAEELVVDGVRLVAGYSYDANDYLASITYPITGTTVDFAPDVLGRPTKAGNFVTATTYKPSGHLLRMTYGNGTTTETDENSRLWPSTFKVMAGAQTLLSNTYTYDTAGNMTAIANAGDPSYNRTFTYDNVNRLTGAQGSWGSGTIQYNGNGDIQSQSYGTAYSLSYAYDATRKRLSSSAGAVSTSYAYDAYGNQLNGGGGVQYMFDDAPNLRLVSGGAGGSIAYQYDGLNLRVAADRAGVRTYEFYNSLGQLFSEYTPAQANRVVEHVYLGGKRVAQRIKDDL